MRLSVCLFVSGMYVELDLVATARLCRVSHKMRITTEDGDLWVNKACKSGRIATAIKDNNNSVLYMYIGGGAVDNCSRRKLQVCDNHSGVHKANGQVGRINAHKQSTAVKDNNNSVLYMYIDVGWGGGC